MTRSWYPRGGKAEVVCPASKEKIGVCGAVNPSDGRLFSLIFDGFDSDTFIHYLKWLQRTFKTKKKIVLVLDNATSHKSNKVKEYIQKRKKKIELLYLPPYSPELNPIERVWKNLRYYVTHNIYFKNLKMLEEAIISYLVQHAKANDSLVKLCCNL